MLEKFHITISNPICNCKKQSLMPQFLLQGTKEVMLQLQCVFCKAISICPPGTTGWYITVTKPYPEGPDNVTLAKAVTELQQKMKDDKERDDKIKAENLKSRAKEEIRRRLN